MKAFIKIAYISLSILFLYYLAQPNPSFPVSLPGAKQSFEPADIETPLRRGYYTDMTRSEVMDHYQNQFSGYRSNYPPEEAQTIIRDQTKSTFLEEITHPFRESLFVNGFEPTEPQYKILIDGKVWKQKIIVRYVESLLWQRLLVGLGVVFFAWVLFFEAGRAFKEFFVKVLQFRLWTSQ